MQQIARYLIIAGILLLIVGLVFYFFGNKFSWLGRLPGDIKIEKENFRFYFPVTTMIIISVLISLILYLIRKFF